MDISQLIYSKLKEKRKIVIGRPGKVYCDIELHDLSVSRPHCQLEWISEEAILVTDLQSKNHTYINGEPLKGTSRTISPSDVIVIGNQVITLKKDKLLNPVALSASSIAKQFGNGVIGLAPCQLEIAEGAFVAIMGPSGCGKSTLLKVLTGADPASQGKVEVFGIDLYANYARIKEMIGLVPQDDIVHKELTVERALYYACHLRANGEVDDKLVEEKISRVLAQLNLRGDIRKSRISELSGGQRKRVSIAIELLSEPKVLFLDEPTSPLDPETINEFLECLKGLANNGTTIIMVTHKPEDLNYVDQVIWLGSGGYLVYQGSPEKFADYFRKKNAVEVYSELYDRDKAKGWCEKWASGKAGVLLNPREVELQKGESFSLINQFRWLTARYLETKLNDRTYMYLLLAQAPVIAMLIGLIFDKFTLSVLFLMNLTALWLGSSNAAREIVAELPIYQRERMFNLRLLPYLASKLTVLTAFSFIQIMVFVLLILLFYNGKDIGIEKFFPTVLLLTFVSFSAVIIGLFLSALVRNSEQAIALLPLLLIPQIILSGVIHPIDNNSLIEGLSCLSLGRNGTAALTTIQSQVDHLIPLCNEMPSLIYAATPSVDALSLPETFGIDTASFWQQFAIMNGLNTIIFMGIVMALKKKDQL